MFFLRDSDEGMPLPATGSHCAKRRNEKLELVCEYEEKGFQGFKRGSEFAHFFIIFIQPPLS